MVADPPYGFGLDYADFTDRFDDYPGWTKAWLAEASQLLRPDGSAWVLCPDENVADTVVALRSAGLHFRNHVCWAESFGTQTNKKFSRCHRTWLYYVKDPRRFVFNAETVKVPSARQTKYNDKRASPGGKVMGDVWGDCPRVCGTFRERVKAEGVPTQLPLKMVRRIVECCSRPGDVVADCFVGSGTTCVAAVMSGRGFIGWEISPRTAEVGRRRVREAIHGVVATGLARGVREGDPAGGPGGPADGPGRGQPAPHPGEHDDATPVNFSG